MKIGIEIQNAFLKVTISNLSGNTFKIWETWNSWGWGSVYLLIDTEDKQRNIILKRDPKRDWTVNYPSFIEIAPGQSFSFTLKGEDLVSENDLSGLKENALMMKAVLEIHETPEAIQYGIFTGKVESEWIQSIPPHNWLFENE